MQHGTIAQWLLLFYIYCFFGWCFESTVVSVGQRKLVNRGFCYGPVIPIYGFGAVAILFATLPVQDSPVLIFLFGMAAATALEYVGGYLCEAIFKVRYWDYTKRRFNVKGYICLRSSLCWGALSVLLTLFLHPRVQAMILSVRTETCNAAAFILTVVFMVDFTCSVKTALDLRDLLAQLEEYSQRAKEDAKTLQRRLEIVSAVRKEELAARLENSETLSRWAESMERLISAVEQDETVRQLREDFGAWKARRAANLEAVRRRMTEDKVRLLRRNPSSSSRHYAQQLQRLKRSIQQRKASHDDDETA